MLEIAQAAGSTIDFVDVWATVDPIPQDLGLHLRPVRLTANFSSTGRFNWEVPFKEKGSFIYGIHLRPTVVANLTFIRYSIDGVPFIEGNREQIHRRLLMSGDRRTAQAANIHLDLIPRNYDQDALSVDIIDGNHEIEMTFANAAPGTFPVLLSVASQDTRPPSAA